MKKPSPKLTRFFSDPETLKGLRNARPNTFPVEPIDNRELVSKCLVQEVPKKLWEGDWVVDLDNDISFLEHHFQSAVGDYIWIAEEHMLTHKTNPTDPMFSEVWAEYRDGHKKKTSMLKEEVSFFDRWLPMVGMAKLASRFVVKVREIGVKWLDPQRTRIIWVAAIEKMPDVEYIFEQERRGCLK